MSYKIKSGDTLSALAKKNNTTIAKILAANKGIKNANSIKAGQSITMPKKSMLDSAKEFMGFKSRENIYKGYKNPLADKLKKKNPSTLKKNKNSKTANAMTKAGENRTKIVNKYKGKPNSVSSSNKGKFQDGTSAVKSNQKKKSSSADKDKKYYSGTNITPTKLQRNRMRKRMGGGT
jgi:hypothetical protein